MPNQFIRTELLLGGEGIDRLKQSRVAVFGIGGVGGAAAEALARSGVGALDLIDNDTVSLSNLNRQIIATHETIGNYKTDVMRDRILSINPEATVHTYHTFFTPETSGLFDFTQYDYVLDAIDTVAGKIELAVCCMDAGTKLISAMGAGNKLDPTRFMVTDLYKTSNCPLARVMRRELRKRGIASLKVVYSDEDARTPLRIDLEEESTSGSSRRQIPGSTAFVPPVSGMIMAGEVVRELAAGN